MSTPETEAPLPTEEQIAAFIDGQLKGRERQEVEQVLAANPDYAELVAEVLALEAEDQEEPEPGKVIDAAARFGSTGLLMLAAAAAVLVALALMLVLRGSQVALDTGEMLAFVPEGERLEQTLPERWFDYSWSTMRGEAAPQAPPRVAFQLGVRTVDLAVALRAEATEQTRFILSRANALVDRVETGELLLLALLQCRMALEDGIPNLDLAKESARQFDEELGSLEPQNAVLAGKWAGAANVALAAEAEQFFASHHWSKGLDLLAAPESDPRLQELAAALRETASDDFPALRSSLDRVIALLGDGVAQLGA
ncbi:MAG: hypothetical protein AAGA81_01530 [Acidobacteriota bacterium]